MSFLSGLGKVLGIAGPILAAPFTGGTSLLGMAGMGAGTAAAVGAGIGGAGKLLGGLGSTAGAAAKGSADQRLAENQQALQGGQLAMQGANNAFTAGLQGAEFQTGQQDRAKSNALLSALLGNLQDAQVTPGNPAIAKAMGTSTGGLRPSALLGGGNREALLAMLSGPGQAPIAAPTYTAPPMPTMNKAGAGENILGGVGVGSSLLGSILPLLQSRNQKLPDPIDDPNLPPVGSFG